MIPDAPTCDRHAIPVSFGSEQWCYVCGCNYRTPLCADKATARQALEAHQRQARIDDYLVAGHDAWCPVCELRIEVGDPLIRWVDGTVTHDGCEP